VNISLSSGWGQGPTDGGYWWIDEWGNQSTRSDRQELPGEAEICRVRHQAAGEPPANPRLRKKFMAGQLASLLHHQPWIRVSFRVGIWRVI
jgi:hypothetical protein